MNCSSSEPSRSKEKLQALITTVLFLLELVDACEYTNRYYSFPDGKVSSGVILTNVASNYNLPNDHCLKIFIGSKMLITCYAILFS